jgi:hypothetical protein
MKKKFAIDRFKSVAYDTALPHLLCRLANAREKAERHNGGPLRLEIPISPSSALPVGHWVRAWIASLALVAVAACVSAYPQPQRVEAKPPSVTYSFSSDNELIAANSKARAYCAQYASTPGAQGTITENPDGTKTVTFECVKAAVVTPPPPAPMSYTYRTDAELLQALRSAEAYCALTGQAVSASIVTNPDGTKSLTFQCVPR